MDSLWLTVSSVALATGSVVTGTLYRAWLVGGHRCSYSLLDSFVGRHGVRFPYSGTCIICAVQSAFEAAEAAAEDGALAGIGEDFRHQYAERPRFLLAFKMRPPDVLWQWGHRPGPLALVPADLCTEHQVAAPSA